MRLGRAMVVTTLATTMVIGTGSVASAVEEDRITVSGSGWLAARGVGSATLDMGGWIRMQLDGSLTIDDVDGDLEVRIATSRAGLDSAPERLGGPEVVLRDFRGYVAVRGSHFLAKAEGRMRFVARGTGFAYLEGRGVYKTRRGDFHRWDPAGGRLELAA